MSAASVSFSFTNATTADATQVNQNFSDLVSFINGSMPHSDGTGGAADPRGLVFKNASDNGNKLQHGIFNMTAIGTGATLVRTLTFPTPFAAAPHVVYGVNGPGGLVKVFMSTVPSTTTVEFTATKDSGANWNAGDLINVHWVGIG